MQRVLTIVAFIYCGALLAGCGGGSGPSADWQTGTHIVRAYSPMSMPAFLPDGSKFVANGTKLLKFSADDALLDTIVLPIHPADSLLPARIYGTAAGSVFIVLGDGRIGRVNAAGQFEWLQDFEAMVYSAVPFGDGLLVSCITATGRPTRLIGSDGKLKLELNASRMAVEPGTTAATGHAFFIVDNSLWVADATGAWVLQAAPVGFEAGDAPWLACAAAGQALMGDGRTRAMECRDVNGGLLWTAMVPEGFQGNGVLMMMPDGSVVFSAADIGLRNFYVQIYAPDGSLSTRLDGLDLIKAAVWDADHFVGVYRQNDERYFGLFTKTGELIWSALKPAQKILGPFKPWEDRSMYYDSEEWTCGPDQRIYYEWQSTLFALDAQGREVWRRAGYEYTQKQVPNGSGQSPPPTKPPTPTAGATKPAS
jgi:hypothetical protein